MVGRLVSIGVSIRGVSVAIRESSPRFVREGNPVIAELNETLGFQLRVVKHTDNISSSSKLAEVSEIFCLYTNGLKSPKITDTLDFTAILHNINES